MIKILKIFTSNVYSPIISKIRFLIRCAYIEIDYPNTAGHAIIGFKTTDKGLIYCEPQYDVSVNLEIGEPFYQCMGEKIEFFKYIGQPEHEWVKPDYDDTVMNITFFW